jgi:hypothetical protein
MTDWTQSNGRLSREEVRTYGRQVGGLTGLLGYFGGALGAWAVNFAAGEAVHPRPLNTIIGALAGIAVVMVFAMWVFWKPYRGRPFSVSWVSVVTNTGQSFGAAVTALLVVVYAGTVVLMWVLACAFLIIAVAT